MDIDTDLLASTLDEAVDALLRVRLQLARLGDIEVPDDAVDAALLADEAHGTACKRFDDALDVLRDALPAEVALVFAAEEAANEVAARASDVSFRLGVGHRSHR